MSGTPIVRRNVAAAPRKHDVTARAPAARLHYVDWLRVLIVYGIALYHIALVFSSAHWLVSNTTESPVMTVFAAFTFTWGLSAMFLISGISAWFALRRQAGGHYLRQRLLRLGIPLVVGTAALAPLQSYFVQSHPPPPLQRLPHFYAAFFGNLHVSQMLNWVSMYSSHLWFLAHLIGVTVLSLPVLLWLRSHKANGLLRRTLTLCERRGGLLLPALPLAVADMAFRSQVAEYQTLGDLVGYTLVFISGAVLISDPRFAQAIRVNIAVMLPTAILAIAAIGVMLQLNLPYRGHSPTQTAWSLVFGAVWGINTWCWIISVMHLGIRFFNVASRAIAYASESVLPFYVIHHPVVVGLASVVVAWNIDLWVKFVVMVVGVYSITLALYEFGIRRWHLTRYLFGLGAAQPQPRPRATPRLASPARG